MAQKKDSIKHALRVLNEADPTPVSEIAGLANANQSFDMGEGDSAWSFPTATPEELREMQSGPQITHNKFGVGAMPIAEAPYGLGQKISNKFRQKIGTKGSRQYAKGQHTTRSRAEQMYNDFKKWTGMKNIHPKKVIWDDLSAYLKLWEIDVNHEGLIGFLRNELNWKPISGKKDFNTNDVPDGYDTMDNALVQTGNGYSRKIPIKKKEFDKIFIKIAANFDEWNKRGNDQSQEGGESSEQSYLNGKGGMNAEKFVKMFQSMDDANQKDAYVMLRKIWQGEDFEPKIGGKIR